MRVPAFFYLLVTLLGALEPKAVPGGLATVSIALPFSAKPPVVFADTHRIPMIYDHSQGAWTGLVPIPLDYDQKSMEIRTVNHVITSIDIEPHHYPQQHITIKKSQYVEPDTKQLERIQDEAVLLKTAIRRFRSGITPLLRWKAPVDGPVSGVFGTQRFFNGQPRSPHRGIDFAVGAGTQINAPAPGKVALSETLYFCGNMLLIDHGQGIYSYYCHLQKPLVAKGDQVKQGEPVGLVGSSGRATGPHLHWGVSVGGVWVDPGLFLDAF